MRKDNRNGEKEDNSNLVVSRSKTVRFHKLFVGHAFILVFSISSRQSLEELKPILEVIGEVKGTMEGFPLLLVGNKCDEESGKRQVSSKTGEALEV